MVSDLLEAQLTWSAVTPVSVGTRLAVVKAPGRSSNPGPRGYRYSLLPFRPARCSWTAWLWRRCQAVFLHTGVISGVCGRSRSAEPAAKAAPPECKMTYFIKGPIPHNSKCRKFCQRIQPKAQLCRWAPPVHSRPKQEQQSQVRGLLSRSTMRVPTDDIEHFRRLAVPCRQSGLSR